MATSIREKARTYLNGIPASVASSGNTASQFTALTGLTHTELKTNWDNTPPSSPGLTSCNAFVNRYGQLVLGSKIALGSFDVDRKLKDADKGHAWVPFIADGPKPKYGDIFLIRNGIRLHMGISLDCIGSTWNTVEGGQGGRRAGFDLIKKKADRILNKEINGWVDIDLLLDGIFKRGTPPTWLVGWWKVSWQLQTWYYYFDRSYEVTGTQIRPSSSSLPPTVGQDKGSFWVSDDNRVTIRWGATGDVETFTRQSTDIYSEEMQGTWNDSVPMTAEQM